MWKFAPVFLALTLCAETPMYRSVSVDQSGQLHIVLDSGKELVPPKEKDSTGFDAAAISPDRRTVGWLVMYPNPTVPNGSQLPGRLVLFRGGRVLHTFSTEQTFWDWQFQDGGKLVAYSTGPTHGGAAECVRRDVDSGKVVDRRDVRGGKDAPEWALPLRY